MTTGLQNTQVRTRDGRHTPWTVVIGFVTSRLRPTATRRSHHAATEGAAMTASRPAHQIRRRARPTRATSVRDLHDSAVLYGIFPPRMERETIAGRLNRAETLPIVAAWEVPRVCRSLWASSSG
jgi:hypothetical protein